jgi:hypothetical protein
VSTRQSRAASNGQADAAYQRARQRRLDRHPDRYVRATSRFAQRGLDVCDCPCHWWPDAREAVACCANRPAVCQVGSQRKPLLSSQMMASPSPATPVMPASA